MGRGGEARGWNWLPSPTRRRRIRRLTFSGPCRSWATCVAQPPETTLEYLARCFFRGAKIQGLAEAGRSVFLWVTIASNHKEMLESISLGEFVIISFGGSRRRRAICVVQPPIRWLYLSLYKSSGPRRSWTICVAQPPKTI